jgi:outer membrane protein TolC
VAQDQNVKMNISREQLQEAIAGQALADKAWLPELEAGVSYYRHEGGIANEDGTLTHSSFGSLFAGVELNGRLDLREAVYKKIDAERKVWQQRGQVSRMTSETLLDAATDYVDLLAARAGEDIAVDIEDKLNRLLDMRKKVASVEKGAAVEVSMINAVAAGERQMLRKLREGQVGAAAKLKYLLNLDPDAELVVMDPQIVPFRLIDAETPTAVLVNEALSAGPGVQEMEGMLATIQRGMDKSKGLSQCLPVFAVQVAEGDFGTGPGSDASYFNRLDLGVHARWNLTQALTAQDRLHQANAQVAQAHLSYQDLRGRLVMGVEESREACLSAAEQMRVTREQIQHARSAYKSSHSRLTNNVPGATSGEVLDAIRLLATAQSNYLEAVRDFDKAQLRLLILTGGSAASEHH